MSTHIEQDTSIRRAEDETILQQQRTAGVVKETKQDLPCVTKPEGLGRILGIMESGWLIAFWCCWCEDNITQAVQRVAYGAVRDEILPTLSFWCRFKGVVILPVLPSSVPPRLQFAPK